MRGTDGNGQRINTGTSDKFAGLFGVGIERIFCIDHQIVFYPAQTAQLGFYAGIIAVAQLHYAFYQRHVLFERRVRAIDHDRADPCLDFACDISQILMMIEVQSEREIPLFRQIAGDRHHVAGAGIAVGTGRAGKDQGGA